MNAAAAIAFPVVCSAVALAFAFRIGSRPSNASRTFLRQLGRSSLIVLLGNFAGSIVFGAYIAARVVCCSSEPTSWLMPLVLAPLEYWFKFGLAIVVFAVTSAFVVVHLQRRTQATSPKPAAIAPREK